MKSILQAGRCSFPSFSPDDSKIAFVSNLAGRSNVFVIDGTGGWLRDGKGLLVTRLGGDEKNSLSLIDMENKKVEYLRLANEGHGFFSKEASLQASSKLVEFFAKQLK